MLTNFVVSEKNRTFAISKHLNMITFDDLETLKETYDKGKYDIFYENGNIKYEVRHLGSTLFCYNIEKGYGMGAINNFNIKGFYGIERPEPVIEEEATDDNQG